MEHFYYVYFFTDGPYSSREYNKKTLQIALCYLVHYPSEVPSLVYIKPCMLGEICKLV